MFRAPGDAPAALSSMASGQTRVPLRPLIARHGLPFLSGLLLAVSFPTWHLFPLAWAALAPLFYCVENADARKTAGRFFVAGIVFHLILLQWLLGNIFWAGGWGVVGHLLLCFGLSLYWAIFGALWQWMRKQLPWFPGALLLALLWGAMEVLQANLFSGFGWPALGYSQGPDLLLAQWASIGGVSLVSVVLVLFNALIAQAARLRRPVAAGISATAVLLLAHGGGWLMLDAPPEQEAPFTVGLLQPDYPQEMKWDPEYRVEMVRNAVEKSAVLAMRHELDLMVWPEALLMAPIESPSLWSTTQGFIESTGVPLFTGAVRAADEGFANSSHLITAEGEVEGWYDKIRLAPFGEYMPFARQFPALARLVPAVGSMLPGEEVKVFPTDSRQLGPLICFEVLFAPMAEELRRKEADMLVVITNLAWFGRSNIKAQEWEISRFRAIETRLPLVHCANTGISGVIDPWGRAHMAGPPHRRFAAALYVPPAAPHPTAWAPPLVRKAFVALAAALAILAVVLNRRRGKTA
jgi:apolipoprotein N-acyltransferase